SLDTYVGYTSVLNQVEMADAQEYITYSNEENAALKKYLDADDTYQLSPDQQYNTDWYEVLLEPGYVANTAASVSGGSDQINYYLSYNFNKEKGVLSNQNFWRHTLRNNNKYHLFEDFLTIEQDLSVSFSRENPQPFGVFNTAFTQSPLVPTFYSNGRYGQPFVNTTTGMVTYEGDPGDKIGRLNNRGNPLTAIDFNHQERHTRQLQGKIAAIFDLTDYLTFTSRLGATKYYTDNRDFVHKKRALIAQDQTRTAEQFEALKEDNPGNAEYASNSLMIKNTESLRWNWDNFLNFSQTIDKHNVDITLGMSSEKVNISSEIRGLAYDVPGKEQYWNLDFASDDYEKEINHINY